jgi:hypothetical protein
MKVCRGQARRKQIVLVESPQHRRFEAHRNAGNKEGG